MTIWKNTCGESWQDTIENGWEGSGKPGAFLFFIPKGALTHTVDQERHDIFQLKQYGIRCQHYSS